MPTILIADDDADHRELLTMALHRYGHQVRAAADAPGALLLAEAGGIDAVVLDVRMPGMTGIELCERLRADPATAGLPVMLVSADVGDARVAAGMAAGADEYVTKPYHRADLTVRLDSLLARRGSASQRAVTAALLAARAAAAVQTIAPTRVRVAPARLTA